MSLSFNSPNTPAEFRKVEYFENDSSSWELVDVFRGMTSSLSPSIDSTDEILVNGVEGVLESDAWCSHRRVPEIGTIDSSEFWFGCLLGQWSPSNKQSDCPLQQEESGICDRLVNLSPPLNAEQIGKPQQHKERSSEALKKKLREAAICRFRQKRKERNFAKTIRYECRKRSASIKPRYKGRFIKAEKSDCQEKSSKEESQLTEEKHQIVPCFE